MKSKIDIARSWRYGRVVARAPQPSDAARLIALRTRSAAFLAPWSPSPRPGENDLAAQASHLEVQRTEWEHDQAYHFILLERESGQIFGRADLGPIIRGAAEQATVAYWLDEGFAHRGLMTEAVRLVLSLAFGPIGLHRVQAPVIPRNVPSIALCRKVGFREEGCAVRFLKIAGEWQDHIIFALTAEEWRSQTVVIEEAP